MDNNVASTNEKKNIFKRFSFWNRRTKTEKCLFAAVGLCVVVIICLASSLSKSSDLNVCLTESCVRASSALLDKIDRSVDPCHDFYNFACGNFIKSTVIPDDKVSISSFTQIRKKVDIQLKNLFEVPIQKDEAHSSKLVKTVYNSCMNTTKIEEEGLTFLKKEFKDCGGWPTVNSDWKEEKFDWKDVFYCLTNKSLMHSVFFGMSVRSDLKDSSRRILTITQPSIPYEMLEKGTGEPVVQVMSSFLVETAVLFGADRETAGLDVKDVAGFLVELSKLLMRKEELLNNTVEYNPITIRELQKKFLNLPWLKLINNYSSPAHLFTDDDVVNLAHPKFFERLNFFLPGIRNRILVNNMFFGIVLDSINRLPERFRKELSQVQKILFGQFQGTPRWKDCVLEATRLNIAVSSLYIKSDINKNTKSTLTELINDVKNSFLDTLKRVEWMDPKTKEHALVKAEKMGALVAYPDELLDDKIVEDFYRDLELNPDDYFLKISNKVSAFHHIKQVLDLKEVVKKPNWRKQANAYKVNAFYLPSDNAIELPAAILQDLFFDPERPQYLNYGAIGHIIGHEITHGFDNQGRQYDKDGNLIDWWEAETAETFTQKSQCFVDQYENYTIPEVDMRLKGLQNLGENIADNGGIKIAYEGYLKWLERNQEEPLLPGLPYTDRQLFWISAATVWCTKYQKEILRFKITLDSHSPDYFRVVVPFRNSDYFAKDFNCSLGSPMNPRSKCRVW